MIRFFSLMFVVTPFQYIRPNLKVKYKTFETTDNSFDFGTEITSTGN
jgi:hypothetical protein